MVLYEYMLIVLFSDDLGLWRLWDLHPKHHPSVASTELQLWPCARTRGTSRGTWLVRSGPQIFGGPVATDGCCLGWIFSHGWGVWKWGISHVYDMSYWTSWLIAGFLGTPLYASIYAYIYIYNIDPWCSLDAPLMLPCTLDQNPNDSTLCTGHGIFRTPLKQGDLIWLTKSIKIMYKSRIVDDFLFDEFRRYIKSVITISGIVIQLPFGNYQLKIELFRKKITCHRKSCFVH